MKKTIAVLGLALGLLAGSAWAQNPPPGAPAFKETLATKALLRRDALDLRRILGLDQPVLEPEAQPDRIRPLHHSGVSSTARRIA